MEINILVSCGLVASRSQPLDFVQSFLGATSRSLRGIHKLETEIKEQVVQISQEKTFQKEETANTEGLRWEYAYPEWSLGREESDGR